MQQLSFPTRRAARRPVGAFRLNSRSPQARGLIGWWPAQDQPNTVRDLVGIANATWTTASVTMDRDREVGSCWKFANAPISFAAGVTPNPAGSPVTISFWINTTSTAFDVVIGFYQGSTPFHGFGATINASGANGFLGYWGGNGAGTHKTPSAGAVNDGRWHLAGITVEGTAIIFYVDGVSVGTATGQQPTTFAGTKNFGADNAGGAAFTGSLADPRIYNRALSPGEMWSLYDHATRWELYDTGTPPMWVLSSGAGGGSTFPALSVAI
jgi:hypothetical protein